jgi:epoxyqueuosine reductase
MVARSRRGALSRPGLDPAQIIRERALSDGFDAIGFASAEAGPQAGEQLAEFLAEGRHGDMGWLADRATQRVSPRALWPDARSVIALGVNYGPTRDPMDLLDRPERGAVSVYARGRDYHDVLKKRLRVLARWIHEEFQTEVKLFVDTAPVMEKPLAERAGIGWQGKHTNLVSREFGSWLFLGEIYTAMDLTPDTPMADHCGSCRACLDVCPTNAFDGPRRIDARRCISYLTIEHKGHIPAELRPLMGNRIYGCDDCLAICPWNKYASMTSDPDLMSKLELDAPRLADFSLLDDTAFREVFSGSPVKRTGRDRFIRNVLIAIGNSNQPDLATRAEALLDDPSALVRAMAVWALSRLIDGISFQRLKTQRLPGETDGDVRTEWETCGSGK